LGKKLHLLPGISVGDLVKSWDVLQTTKFLNENIKKTDPVLDIGCYASEITSILFKLGYSNLCGADLNPQLHKMPYQDSIKYQVTDFMHTPFADGSFTAVTSISVIEHGFNPHPLLAEVTRLLRPQGYFIASFDYWPDKIDTADIKFFNMDWKIFSKEEVAEFIQMAATYGLTPVGELTFEAQERPIECGGRAYTFGWLVLTKR
jgi:SAM-dependent methyltransferase